MAQVGNLIVVGTYEEFVLGYAIVPEDNNEKKLSLVQNFACHSHRASVRCLATGGPHLASGSSDETIHLYDMVTQVETGLLTHHTGTVNTLAFTENGKHLLSGADDGTIAVVKTGSWFLEKKWESAHKGSVTCISVHPSGKLALSAGTDNRLVTWNLVKGKRAYVTNLSSRCPNGWGVGGVMWSSMGDKYAAFMASHVEVYSVSTAGVAHTIACSNRITAITFLKDDLIVVGEESGEAAIFGLEEAPESGEEGNVVEKVRFQAHDRRVKCVNNLGPVEDGSKDAIHFVTAGGNGVISLWSFEDSEVVKLTEVKTGCRITCMNVVDFSQVISNSDTKSVAEAVSEKKNQHSIEPKLTNGGKKEGSKRTLLSVEDSNKEGSHTLKKKRRERRLASSMDDEIPPSSVKSVNAGKWKVTPLS